MWYLAEILFAEPPRRDDAEYRCESCNVVLRADAAAQAYQKAVAWGEAYSAEPASTSKLLGVAHLTSIGEELSDGVEICGRFFEARAVWDRVGEYIPPPEQLAAIRWEAGRDTSLAKLLSPEQLAQLRRTWGRD